MSSRIFEVFCEMLENLPAGAVLKAVSAERRMIEGDLERTRAAPNHEENSILAVCRFIEVVAEQRPDSLPEMTVDQWAVCRRVVQRLIAAGELPRSIETHLDALFSAVLRRAYA